MKNSAHLIFPIFFLLAYSSTARANLLPAFAPVIVSAGDIVEHVIEIRDEDREGARVEIKLISKPDGARIVVDDEGRMILTWKTSPELDDETELVIQAKNVDTGDIIQRQELLVRKVFVVEDNDSTASVAREPLMQAGNPVLTAPTAPKVPTVPVESFGENTLQESQSTQSQIEPDLEKEDNPFVDQEDSLAMLTEIPTLDPQSTQVQILPDVFVSELDKTDVDFGVVSNQIVSAGRTVTMRFDASSNDGEDPVLTIDRLPENASFEKNLNGDYLLFWQTGDRDQGEYVFKVTAQHPLDNSISKSIYWTLVVGDPSLSKSVPEDFDELRIE